MKQYINPKDLKNPKESKKKKSKKSEVTKKDFGLTENARIVLE